MTLRQDDVGAGDCGFPASQDFPMYGYESSGSRYNPEAIGPASITEAEPTVQWSVESTASVSTAPIVVDGVVYGPIDDDAVVAIDFCTGRELWRTEVGDYATARPVYHDGVVYVACWEGGLHGLDADTGERVLSNAFERHVATLCLHDGDLYVANQHVDFTHDPEVVGRYDLELAETWRTTVNGSGGDGRFAIGDGVLVVDASKRRFGYDVADGEERWSASGTFTNSGFATANGLGYNGGWSGYASGPTVAAYDLQTGDIALSAENAPSIYTEPLIADGTVFFGGEGGVVSYGAETFSAGRRYRTDESVTENFALADGVLYVGDSGGTVYAFDVASGVERWRVDLGSKIRSTVTVADGWLLVGTADHTLYALGDEAARATPTPTATRVDSVAEDLDAYDLREARRTRVQVGDAEYYVLQSIPGADPGVCAVTTPDYELTPPGPARDALLTYVLSSSSYRFDWERERAAAEERLENARRFEWLNRAADMGVDVISGFLSARKGAVGDTLEAAYSLLDSSITWANKELEDPYKRAFAEMAGSVQATRRFQSDLESVHSVGEFPERIKALSDGMIDLYRTVGEDGGAGVVSAGVVDMATDLADVGYGTRAEEALDGGAMLIAGGELDVPVAQLEAGLDIRARIAAILHAYETVRIPMMAELQTFVELKDDNRLDPAAGLRFHTTFAAYHYLGAVAFAAVAELYRNLTDLLSGRFWNVLDSAEEEREFFAAGAQNRLDAANLQWTMYGAGVEDAGEMLAASINAELYGEVA